MVVHRTPNRMCSIPREKLTCLQIRPYLQEHDHSDFYFCVFVLLPFKMCCVRHTAFVISFLDCSAERTWRGILSLSCILISNVLWRGFALQCVASPWLPSSLSLVSWSSSTLFPRVTWHFRLVLPLFSSFHGSASEAFCQPFVRRAIVRGNASLSCLHCVCSLSIWLQIVCGAFHVKSWLVSILDRTYHNIEGALNKSLSVLLFKDLRLANQNAGKSISGAGQNCNN